VRTCPTAQVFEIHSAAHLLTLRFAQSGASHEDNDSTIGDVDSTSMYASYDMMYLEWELMCNDRRTQSVTSSVYSYRFEDGRRYHVSFVYSF
jgi:hypothetical protein